MTSRTAQSDSGHRSPRVGYLFRIYPRFNHTLIINEIIGMAEHGMNLRITSLRRPAEGTPAAKQTWKAFPTYCWKHWPPAGPSSQCVRGIPNASINKVTELTGDPSDEPLLAETIWRILNDATLRDRMGGDGYRQVAKRYSADQNMNRIFNWLMEAAGAARKSSIARRAAVRQSTDAPSRPVMGEPTG